MMTRSIVREPDPENQSDLPVQRCSIPGDTSKLAGKNMDAKGSPGTNGIITTRYGRCIKFLHSPEDNQPAKSPKTPKESQVTAPPVTPSPKRSENSITPETKKKSKIVDEKSEVNEEAIKHEPLPELPDPKEYVTESVRSILTGEKDNSQCEWVLGQLAWAHVSNYPYWPCIVTVDPIDQTHRKERPFGKRIIKMVHVQYFGDNKRHNWVNENYLMLFEGLDHFNNMARELLKGKKKNTKFYSGYVVKTVIKHKWDTAVSEAEILLPIDIKERLRALAPKRKRGRPRLSQESAAKKPRLVESIDQNCSNTNLETVEKSPDESFQNSTIKDPITLPTDTPPTPPSSIKDSSDESSIVKKHKRFRRSKAETSLDFENYFKIHKDDPNLVPNKRKIKADVRKHLRDIWDGMTAYHRNKYRIWPRVTHDTVKEKSSTTEEDLTLSLVEATPKKRKSKGTKDKEKLNMSIDAGKRARLNMFKRVKAARVCQICEKPNNLTRCKGPCYSYFHLKCVKPGESESESESTEEDAIDSASSSSGDVQKKVVKEETIEDETFKCIDCLSGVAPACFICNEREDERIRCSMATCGKHYHLECLKLWPQSHWQGGRLTCPYHMCHTCISDNPQIHHSRIPNDKLARCVRCPSAYHASPQCLPAGSKILTSTQIICPKHYVATQPPLNAAWCFLCTRGGSLICCDTCPTSFHPECLGIDAPDGAFICEDCETGRLPLYGEVVWVKLGNYRWWPSRICYPHEVPTNLEALAHSVGEFCVMFLGTKNYYWVHRGRVFLYQEGDSCAKISIGRKNVDEAYKQAVNEANELHQLVKIQRIAAKEGEECKMNLKPPPYVKLRVNKPVDNVKPMEVESMVPCECDPKWKNPCSADSDCLNRILFAECNPTICPAGAKCNNQSFVRRVYPLMEPFHTAGRGWGLRTLEAIKSEQFVIEYVGEVIDEAEYKRRLNRKKELRNENYYFLTLDNFRTIDAEPKGNLSRFMNHSCQPNCETQKWTVNGDTRIGLFTLRDIEAGEELTFNYNLATEGETKKPCLCGAPNCSGYIGLKAQKPQNFIASIIGQQTEKEKAEKVEKVKRRRKSMKVYKCWRCGEVVSLAKALQCGYKTCSKKYHKKCVKRVDTTESRFSCPWHHCTDCGKRTTLRCLLCSTAYCSSHLEGNMTERKDKNGYFCKVHENTLGDNLEETLDGINGGETLGDTPLDISQGETAENPADDSLRDLSANDILEDATANGTLEDAAVNDSLEEAKLNDSVEDAAVNDSLEDASANDTLADTTLKTSEALEEPVLGPQEDQSESNAQEDVIAKDEIREEHYVIKLENDVAEAEEVLSEKEVKKSRRGRKLKKKRKKVEKVEQKQAITTVEKMEAAVATEVTQDVESREEVEGVEKMMVIKKMEALEMEQMEGREVEQMEEANEPEQMEEVHEPERIEEIREEMEEVHEAAVENMAEPKEPEEAPEVEEDDYIDAAAEIKEEDDMVDAAEIEEGSDIEDAKQTEMGKGIYPVNEIELVKAIDVIKQIEKVQQIEKAQYVEDVKRIQEVQEMDELREMEDEPETEQEPEMEENCKDEVMSIAETKFDSDDDYDTASLLADSDGSMRDEDVIPPRASIVEIELSSEESDDIRLEDDDVDMKLHKKDIDIKLKDEDIDGMIIKEDIMPVPVKRRRKSKYVDSLTTHPLHQMVNGKNCHPD